MRYAIIGGHSLDNNVGIWAYPETEEKAKEVMKLLKSYNDKDTKGKKELLEKLSEMEAYPFSCPDEIVDYSKTELENYYPIRFEEIGKAEPLHIKRAEAELKAHGFKKIYCGKPFKQGKDRQYINPDTLEIISLNDEIMESEDLWDLLGTSHEEIKKELEKLAGKTLTSEEVKKASDNESKEYQTIMKNIIKANEVM